MSNLAILTNMQHYLLTLRNFLNEKGFYYDESLAKAVMHRNNGGQFTLADHVKAMVYSLLTNHRKWVQIEEHIPEINKLFFNWDVEKIKQTPGEYFAEGIKNAKCGNISTNQQMSNLSSNIEVLENIQKEYGSLDKFVSSDEPAVIKDLLSNSPKYKIKGFGERLAAEYLRNVGIDDAKSDVHLTRFLGADRMGSGKNSPATIQEANEQIEALSKETGLKKWQIDQIIWQFCATGYAEVCTAKPNCLACPIKQICNKI